MQDYKGSFKHHRIDTLCTLGVGIFGLRYPTGFLHKSTNRWNLALQVAFLNACYRSTQLILYWEDPTTVGPNMASIMLGLMYGLSFGCYRSTNKLTLLSPLEHPFHRR